MGSRLLLKVKFEGKAKVLFHGHVDMPFPPPSMPCQGVRLRTSAVFLKNTEGFDKSVLVVDLQKQQPVHEL